MRYVVRSARRVSAILAVAVLGALLMAVPAMAQQSTITQADCDAGRITQNGKRISQEACEARVGEALESTPVRPETGAKVSRKRGRMV